MSVSRAKVAVNCGCLVGDVTLVFRSVTLVFTASCAKFKATGYLKVCC